MLLVELIRELEMFGHILRPITTCLHHGSQSKVSTNKRSLSVACTRACHHRSELRSMLLYRSAIQLNVDRLNHDRLLLDYSRVVTKC